MGKWRVAFLVNSRVISRMEDAVCFFVAQLLSSLYFTSANKWKIMHFPHFTYNHIIYYYQLQNLINIIQKIFLNIIVYCKIFELKSVSTKNEFFSGKPLITCLTIPVSYDSLTCLCSWSCWQSLPPWWMCQLDTACSWSVAPRPKHMSVLLVFSIFTVNQEEL